MTDNELLERMKKDLQKKSNFELEHMLAIYDTLVIDRKKDIDKAKEHLEKTKREREVIVDELAKRIQSG